MQVPRRLLPRGWLAGLVAELYPEPPPELRQGHGSFCLVPRSPPSAGWHSSAPDRTLKSQLPAARGSSQRHLGPSVPEARQACIRTDPQSPEADVFRRAAGEMPEVSFGLSSSAAVLSHYGAPENTVALFRRVDNDRRDLDMNNRDVDAKKLTRFVRMNELRLVTEYNPVTAIGVMQSSLQFNLLLITDKMSPKHPERMRKFRAAAELYKGKILFILLDSNLKSNERVLSYFQLKKSQLPALAIFHTPDDEHDLLTVDDISIEHVQDFCNRFQQRMQKKEDKSEEKPLNEEL
ncbi:endoplasmic reticulum resident protein 27 isoform X1 [Cyanistes caeruleus]|uniref:Endoplasmic reticulum protein 27 n=1 Tax=Cyanistes caeruleus TaxID=156563 RepID=A0A8C0U9R1_CYACU|nr:endoplasmic reticulum resident protein 27 isoform X1 [Cyanistes caeruleus]